MVTWPPPGGNRNACAHAPAGDGTWVSALPLSVALQPPAGSASSRVPPAAGAGAPETDTGPDRKATTVPFGSTTLALAGTSVSRHRAKAEVAVTGRRPATPSRSRARLGSTGAGRSTKPMSNCARDWP